MNDNPFTIGQVAWCGINSKFYTFKNNEGDFFKSWELFPIIGKKDDHVILLLRDPYKGGIIDRYFVESWNIDSKYVGGSWSCILTKMLRPGNYIKCSCGKNLLLPPGQCCWECMLQNKT